MTRLPMRKIREVLRLAAGGMFTRQIAASLSLGRTTLREYLGCAKSAGFSWPLPDDLSDVIGEATFADDILDRVRACP